MGKEKAKQNTLEKRKIWLDDHECIEIKPQKLICKGCGKKFVITSILRHISHSENCKNEYIIDNTVYAGGVKVSFKKKAEANKFERTFNP